MKMVIDRNIVISQAGSVLCTQIERAGRIDKSGKNQLPSVKQWRLKVARVFPGVYKVCASRSFVQIEVDIFFTHVQWSVLKFDFFLFLNSALGLLLLGIYSKPHHKARCGKKTVFNVGNSERVHSGKNSP